jgi:23S rRNA pseudouridine955/2504/2580 synthase
MEIKSFYVQESDDGLRLDRLFHRHLPHAPYGLVNKLIRKGQIRIDGKRAKNNTRVQLGQYIKAPACLSVDFEPKEFSVPANFEKIKSELMASIIHEDDQIIVFNKASNLCVQDGSKVSISIDRILKIAQLGYHLVHRIDKETTGLLVVAKNHAAAAAMSELFRDRKVSKTYLAVLSSSPAKASGIIKSLIDEVVSENSQENFAETKYKIIANSQHGQALGVFQPISGKKHQIRKHALALGTPIIGDNKHRNITVERNKAEKNLYLHAYKLLFKLNKTKYNLCAPLPEYFTTFLQADFPNVDLNKQRL